MTPVSDRGRAVLLAVSFVPALAAAAGEGAGPAPGPDFVKAAKAVRPAVVTILSEKRLPPISPGGREERIRELGSGFVVREDGILLTNAHVVSNAVSLKVRLADGREVEGEIVGEDRDTDLAAVRLPGPGPYPVAALGDSSKLEVGQWVLAVGSSLGFEQTVSHGIVSGIGRTGVGFAKEEFLLQTDAPVHRGNSGGPLVDLEGRVIAVNAAVASGPGASPQGMGFAIPANLVRRVLEDLLARGEVARSWVGVREAHPLDDALAKRLGYPSAKSLKAALAIPEDRGAVEAGEILPGSPAARAGLRSGDLILSFAGKPVSGPADLKAAISESRVGDEAELEVLREGKAIRVPLVVGIRPRVEGAMEEGPGAQGLGLAVVDLTDDLAYHLGYRGESGALVRRVDGPPAIRVDLRKGDLIQAVGQRAVGSAEEFVRAVREARSLRAISVEFRRGAERKRILLEP